MIFISSISRHEKWTVIECCCFDSQSRIAMFSPVSVTFCIWDTAWLQLSRHLPGPGAMNYRWETFPETSMLPRCTRTQSQTPLCLCFCVCRGDWEGGHSVRQTEKKEMQIKGFGCKTETLVEPLNKRNENCVQVNANVHFQTSRVYTSYNLKFTQAEIAKQNYLLSQ